MLRIPQKLDIPSSLQCNPNFKQSQSNPEIPTPVKYCGALTKLVQLNFIIAIFPPTNNMNRFRKMVMVCYVNEDLEWQQFFEAELSIMPKSDIGCNLMVRPLARSSDSINPYRRIGSLCCRCCRSTD